MGGKKGRHQQAWYQHSSSRICRAHYIIISAKVFLFFAKLYTSVTTKSINHDHDNDESANDDEEDNVIAKRSSTLLLL